MSSHVLSTDREVFVYRLVLQPPCVAWCFSDALRRQFRALSGALSRSYILDMISHGFKLKFWKLSFRKCCGAVTACPPRTSGRLLSVFNSPRVCSGVCVLFCLGDPVPLRLPAHFSQEHQRLFGRVVQGARFRRVSERAWVRTPQQPFFFGTGSVPPWD